MSNALALKSSLRHVLGNKTSDVGFPIDIDISIPNCFDEPGRYCGEKLIGSSFGYVGWSVGCTFLVGAGCHELFLCIALFYAAAGKG